MLRLPEIKAKAQERILFIPFFFLYTDHRKKDSAESFQHAYAIPPAAKQNNKKLLRGNDKSETHVPHIYEEKHNRIYTNKSQNMDYKLLTRTIL
jgi:hypothetical protein